MKYLHIDQVGYQVVTIFWFLVFIYLQIVKTNCLIRTLLTELSSLRLVLEYQSFSFLNSSTNSSPIFSLEVLPAISSDFLLQQFLYTFRGKIPPCLTKLLRYNTNVFMSKEVRKGIVSQSKRKSTFSENSSYENWCKYKPQCNLSVNMLSNTKKKLFRNLN